MNEINNFCHPVTLAWFSIQILVNSKIFKLSLNLSFTHLRAQIAFKGDLSSIMLKERFNDSLEILEFTFLCLPKVGYVIKSCKEPIPVAYK